jgi:hypothetical protein
MRFELARLDDLLLVFWMRVAVLDSDYHRLIHFVGYNLSV